MSSSKTPLKLGHEYVSADEDIIIAEMVAEMQAQVDKMYANRKMLRQVHTKMHGCVRAKFEVEKDLPKELQVGVFKAPKTYHAWVRFSNASTQPKADKKKDIRGCAIKLMGVEGEKILTVEGTEEIQDFLLMSSETFFSHNLADFRRLLKLSTSSQIKTLLYLLSPLHMGLLKRLGKSTIKCQNPLAIPYWSTQPYQWGSPDKAVKYFLKPSPDNVVINENFEDYDYLRVNMAQTLNSHEIKYDFYVQFQTDADAMPIEDPTVPWESQFQKVATLTIVPQSFDSEEQMNFGENLSFNSWHTLTEHRPLGSFNRARRRVYETMSSYRHHWNNLVKREPTDSPDFLDTGHALADNAIHTMMPTNGVVKQMAQVNVKCSKETAYKYISSGPELCTWLKKAGPVPGALNVENEGASYNEVGDKRMVYFESGDSCQEELLSSSPYANYSYRVTKFSNFLNKLTKGAYAQMWFDTYYDETRITWVYAFTYKNIFTKLILKLFLALAYKKYMKNGLEQAKGVIENGDSP